MELYRNAYQIQSLYGKRNLFQYLFIGDDIVLLDSGVAETPERAILPYLDDLRIDPRRISQIVTTHPDLDHQGGNSALKKVASNARLACGEADRKMVEDPRALFQLRYNFAKAEHGVGFESDEPWPDAGKAQNVDAVFRGGETIRVSHGWDLDVLHVPGHSHGHLAFYDGKHRTAFVSDAIHGRGCPNSDGCMGIPVTYYFVDMYLTTLRYFESLAIDVLYSGHWPTMRGEEVKDFIADSRRTVEFLDRVTLQTLANHRQGLSLKELINSVANAVGEWPRDTWFLATYSVKGHLDRLTQQNKIRIVPDLHPPRWQLVA